MSVESAMERIRAADDENPTERFDREQQHEMYEKSLESLRAIDADDDDEGVTVVADWIVDRLSDGARPSSVDVRQRAQTFCRANGYEIPNDSWLGR